MSVQSAESSKWVAAYLVAAGSDESLDERESCHRLFGFRDKCRDELHDPPSYNMGRI